MTPVSPARRSAGTRRTRFAAALLGITVLGACGNDEATPHGSETGDDPGPVHVHGLGVNPRDGALFIATHTGLFRLGSDDRRARRVGDLLQDTMGFAVIGPDRFLGSGHPDARTDLPPFLGLIRSDDAGKAWDSVSLQGESDFHILRARGEMVYGFGSDWETRAPHFRASSDGGRTWQARPFPEPFVDLIVHPTNPLGLVAAGQRASYESTDGGKRWRPLGTPGGGLLAWPVEDRLIRAQADGAVVVSRDAGRSWRHIGSLGGEPSAFAAADEMLYASLHDGRILESGDGGATWTERARP